MRDLATCRSHTLPAEPAFPNSRDSEIQYVLLAGDHSESNAVGRQFQVVKARVVSLDHRRYLQTQTFSSEHDAWGPYTEIRAPHIVGGSYRPLGRPLIVGDVVYWLCLLSDDRTILVVKLQPKEARVTLSKLPFPHVGRCLLATSSAGGGSPIILVADDVEISTWVQIGQTMKWKKSPQPVIKNEAIIRFDGVDDESTRRRLANSKARPHLQWFAERSGVVLIEVSDFCYFWLDLQSKKIVRWFSGSRYLTVRCPYEMDLSSWVPTFSTTSDDS